VGDPVVVRLLHPSLWYAERVCKACGNKVVPIVIMLWNLSITIAKNMRAQHSVFAAKSTVESGIEITNQQHVMTVRIAVQDCGKVMPKLLTNLFLKTLVWSIRNKNCGGGPGGVQSDRQ
jgi:nitrogen-specific signal transduction histidine kinase